VKDAIYFPILRARRGEINAVAALRPATKIAIRPMFDVPAIDEDGSAMLTMSTVASTLARTWGTALPLYIDMSRHDPDALVESDSAVAHLFDCARQAGLCAIPVSAPVRDRQGNTGAYFDGVAKIGRKDQRGVALRVDFEYFSDVDSLETLLRESMRAVDAIDESTDVFLDCGPLEKIPANESTTRALMTTYSLALLALEGRRFRNVIVCASNIPSKVDRIRSGGTPHRVANSEFSVWGQIVGHKNNRTVKFSDYGARHAHQKDGGGGSRPPARIHLVTSDQHHLYLDDAQRYRQLCDSAMHSEEFSRQAWGTRVVRECARGSGDYGGATEWVERDTHMHLETMATLVGSRLAEIGALAAFDFAKPESMPHDQTDLLTST